MARIDAIAHLVLATITPADADTGETPARAEAEGLAHGRRASDYGSDDDAGG